MRWFLKVANSPGEARCKKSWDQFEKYGSLSLRCVKQVSGKRKDHRLEEYKSNILISEVPTLWNLRPVPWRDWKTTAMRPMQGTEPCQKHIQAQRKNKATFHSPAEECVLPAASTKEPKEREFPVDWGASVHMVSKRDLNSAELETMRTSRSPTTVMTANDEVQTIEEATVFVKELDLFVTVMLLEETPAVLSLGKLCEDHGYTYHWTSENHISPKKGQENRLQHIQLCTIRSPWFIYEFLYNAHTYYSIIFITGFCVWRKQIHRKSSTRKKWKYEWRVTGQLLAWTNRNRKQK